MRGYFKNSSGFIQTIVLLAVCVGSICFCMFLNQVYLLIFPENLRATLILQNSLPLFLAACITQYLISDLPLIKAFGLNRPGWALPLIGILTFWVSGPFIGALNEWNQQLVLPDCLRSLEEWMISNEKQVAELTDSLLNTHSPGKIITNLIQVAILAGICEELFFRGVILRIMIRWTGSVHAGIWCVAFIFSAIHLQFFGFLPRLFLGAVLGYLYALSGTLWVPIIAHIANNAWGIITFSTTADEIFKPLSDPGIPLWLSLPSLLLVCCGLLLTRKFALKKRSFSL